MHALGASRGDKIGAMVFRNLTAAKGRHVWYVLVRWMSFHGTYEAPRKQPRWGTGGFVVCDSYCYCPLPSLRIHMYTRTKVLGCVPVNSCLCKWLMTGGMFSRLVSEVSCWTTCGRSSRWGEGAHDDDGGDAVSCRMFPRGRGEAKQ